MKISYGRPTEPVVYTKEEPFKLSSPESDYWVYVPGAYDSTNETPMTLFVWLHGCGGEASGDIWDVSPGGAQDWISVSLGGRDGQCWDVDADQSKVLAAIASMKTHFNINSRKVVLGGYSSGGDLAYRTIFYNANNFAGVLAACTSPFRDTGSTPSASLAAATWKFNVAHLAMIEDDTYPIAGVRFEINQLANAGYPVSYVERNGTHIGCDYVQVRANLLPHLDDAWLAPIP